MASKEIKIFKKNQHWTDEETNMFVEVLVDQEYNFAECLEKRALKRSANEEVFIEILNVLKSKLNSDHFKKLNNKNLTKI